jgi:hypothetical protein
VIDRGKKSIILCTRSGAFGAASIVEFWIASIHTGGYFRSLKTALAQTT